MRTPRSRTGFFDVSEGCAGDMLVASLLSAGLDPGALRRELARIPLQGYRTAVRKTVRDAGFGHGIRATTFRVLPERGAWDDRTPYAAIVSLIRRSTLPDARKEAVLRIFRILAEAEADVHGEPLERVHFHEVGQVDAIVEVAAVVIGLGLLGVSEVRCGPLALSRPAPATARLARGIPTLPAGLPFETATPTGVAILRGVCAGFGSLPGMTLGTVGYGAGMRAQPPPNVVRFFLSADGTPGRVLVMETAVDDCSPLVFETVFERLFAAGALDVTILPGQGKKNRPVFTLRIVAPEDAREALARIVFEETTTLGIRFRSDERIVLDRSVVSAPTPWGPVPVKVASLAGRVVNAAPEYDACRDIARREGVPFKQVYREAERSVAPPRADRRRRRARNRT